MLTFGNDGLIALVAGSCVLLPAWFGPRRFGPGLSKAWRESVREYPEQRHAAVEAGASLAAHGAWKLSGLNAAQGYAALSEPSIGADDRDLMRSMFALRKQASLRLGVRPEHPCACVRGVAAEPRQVPAHPDRFLNPILFICTRLAVASTSATAWYGVCLSASTCRTDWGSLPASSRNWGSSASRISG